MLALRTLSITKADYISCHLIKIPQRDNPKRDYLGFRGFSSVTWTHVLGLQHVAGGGCPLDCWPEALRGLWVLSLLSLFPSLSSCCCPAVTPPSSTLSSFPRAIYLPNPNSSQDLLWSLDTFLQLTFLGKLVGFRITSICEAHLCMCLGEPFQSVSQGGEDPPRIWHYSMD